MVRLLCVSLICLIFVGCGSDSADGPSAAAPVTLSIPSPEAADAAVKEDADAITNPVVEQLKNRARESVAAGEPGPAIEALSQAIGLAPQDSQLFHLRADVYVLLREFANAQADYSLAIQADPQNAQLYNVRGYFLMQQGAANDAIADFTKAIALDSQFAPAFNNRGLVRLAMQDYAAALDDFQQAVSLKRDYADALNNRGFTHMKLDDFTEALQDLKQVLKLNPDYTTAWNNCGLVYLKQEKYSDAAEAFSEAIRLAPFDTRWLGHRRTAYQKAGRFEDANADSRRIRWLAELTSLTNTAAGNGAQGWIRRAEHLVEGEEFEAAVQDYGRALRLAPDSTTAMNGRAMAWLKAGDLPKAIADCDVSLVNQPTQTAYSIRGDAWLALGNYDQAIADLEAGQRFDSAVADAYRQRASQHRNDGNTELAEADQARAAEIEAALAGQLDTAEAGRQPLPFPESPAVLSKEEL